MTRLALALAATLALPAAAQDMTDAEREAFRAEVRSYLLEHPEVLMESFQVLESRQMEQQADADIKMLEDNRAALTEDPASWVGGNPEGDVTVVEFADYRCGYCRRAYSEVEDLVEKDGNIRLIRKEYPILGPQSVLSSQFAIAVLQTAGAEAYDKVHEALITMRGDATNDSLRRVAVDQGLDADAIMARMTSPEVAAVIQANHQLGQTLQINGTPTFVIEKTMVRGYVPQDSMAQIVAQMRAR